MMGPAFAVEPNQKAAVGLIYDANIVFCSGLAISKRLVVTASHCLQISNLAKSTMLGLVPPLLFAKLQGIGMGPRPFERKIGIKRTAVHPGFDLFSIADYTKPSNDVALLELDSDIPADVTPLEISAPEEGDSFEAYGYGSTSVMPFFPNPLVPVAVPAFVPFISFQKITILDRTATLADASKLEFDVSSSAPGGTICLGDSGSPILSRSSGKAVGIISYGPSTPACGQRNIVATSLSKYIDWIEKQAADFGYDIVD